MTAGLSRISAGVPSAILRPNSRTTMRSVTPITSLMSCSMRRTVYPWSRTLRISSMSLAFSAGLKPAAGFNPAEKATLMELIRRVRDQGYTVLLIEHDMRLVMGVTDRIVVLEFGRKIAEGTPAEIRDNPAVIAAYLGVDEDAS